MNGKDLAKMGEIERLPEFSLQSPQSPPKAVSLLLAQPLVDFLDFADKVLVTPSISPISARSLPSISVLSLPSGDSRT